ncbi:hypothetical protein ACFFX1_54360 [Dactylosporangium sucinum]|uniref:Acyl-CoA synthase n=1 Tax=Dactylosporangium sucinum TaxID=1424081 RepID=A0A917X362_9ACTN|nr:acyl-CoA synthase [Dactylosporangium sucinum]GGM64469.1 hypothetical protein GCM10007977_077400 [Dactylosporangium sucinum]
MSDSGNEAVRAAALQDEEDYDLLTYTEAGLRLQEAIAAQAELAEADPAQQPRLDALLAAQERISHRAVNDENFERFFGYPASAKRSGVQ